MRLRVVWWIPVAAVALAHVSGVLGEVGTAISGIDKIIGAVIDIRGYTAKAPPPKITVTREGTTAKMPTKAKAQ